MFDRRIAVVKSLYATASIFVATLILITMSLRSVQAQTTPTAAERKELLEVRRLVWDSYFVGDQAKRQAVTNPKRTVYSIKRFMGRRHNEVESEEKLVPYKLVGGANDLVKVEIDQKQFSPPEISS